MAKCNQLTLLPFKWLNICISIVRTISCRVFAYMLYDVLRNSVCIYVCLLIIVTYIVSKDKEPFATGQHFSFH